MVNMVTTEGELTNGSDRPAYLALGEEEDSEEPPPRPPLVYDPAEWCYDMSGKKLMLIFSHCEYQKTLFFGGIKPKTRKGTKKDVSSLTETFEGRGFQVFVHGDKGHLQILKILRAFCAQDHRSTSCVCVCVLTHGGRGGELFAADTPYNIRDLLSILHYEAADLVGKPKLVVAQACRGGLLDPGQVLCDGPEDALQLPVYPDMLVLTGSVEDFKSWRNSKGSWLILELCRVMREHPHLDILQMFTLVTSYVAQRQVKKSSIPRRHKTKQTPELRHALTKLLRFPPPPAQAHE